jgi:hypothetical protein
MGFIVKLFNNRVYNTEWSKRKQIKSATSSFVLSKSLSELDTYGYVPILAMHS